MKPISIFLLVILLSGCKNHSEPAVDEQVQYRAGRSEMPYEAERELYLQGGDLLKTPIEISSFQIQDQSMYLLDMYGLQQAFIYNLSGQLVKLVGGPGPGPGEYRYPGGFCRSEDRLHLISSGRKYMVYDLDGGFITQNLDVHPGGIGNKIHPGPKGTAFFTCYSRHVPEATIFHVDANGALLNQFSPPDSEFILFWDKVEPMGNILVTGDHILQIFIHKYQVKRFSTAGEELGTFSLASGLYNGPDYEKARGIEKKGGKAQKKFMNQYTLVKGFYPIGQGYVTVLANTTREPDREYLEFWNAGFLGLGRQTVNRDERLVGTFQKDLVFYHLEKQALIFRKLALDVAPSP